MLLIPNMLLTPKTDAVWKLALGILPWSAIALSASPSLAQASIPNATVLCAYSPDSGVPNVLGMRSYITAGQVGNDTVFVFEQFSSPVLNENDSNILTDVSSRRSLTIYGQPIAAARQILVDSPKSYAALIGSELAPDDSAGFAPVNATLACQDVSADNIANADNIPNAPTPTPMPTPMPAPTPSAEAPVSPPTEAPIPTTPAPVNPQATFADLPDGNYRVASATYPPRVVEDAELIENGGVLFLFRKLGDTVTGRFSYIDSDLGACVTGKITGDRVTGQAYTDYDSVSPEENTAIFLGPGGYLQLGENEGASPRTGASSYRAATLNLAGFSRINAGIALPPESCP